MTIISQPIEQVVADTETIKLVESHNQTIVVNKNPNHNSTKTSNSTALINSQPQNNQTIVTTTATPQTPISLEDELKRQTIDLIVDEDSSHSSWTISNQSNRHAYNIGYERNSNTLSPLEGLNASDSNEDLSVADSRFIPKSASSRFDEDVEIIEDDGPSFSSPSSSTNSNDNDPSFPSTKSYDSSSSNLSEQKVVKELTKMLSRGISSATDQVGLDTLENWKRRSRKRKAIKDNRAKLFEDLLNAAIVSHPERSSKKKTTTTSRKRTGSKSSSDTSSKQSPYAYSAGILSTNPEVDSDVASDADNLISHLQGLSTLLDTGANSVGASESAGDDSSRIQDETVLTGSSEELNESEGLSSSSSSSDSSDDAPSKPKKASGSTNTSDRPLVRQFKKIKKQISQRRKQLDQIKKIFNIDLALNPKDGSLMGKSLSSSSSSSSSSKKHEETSASNSDDEEMTPRDNPKKRSGNNKMRELMQYLKRNPEILASVMAELTTGLDPTSQNHRSSSSSSSSAVSGANSEDSSSHYQTINMGTYSSGRALDSDASADSIDRFESPVRKQERPPISSRPSSQFGRHNFESAHSGEMLKTPLSAKTYSSGISKSSKSAEALLLASLRERQLMNLARLEMVLAERQAASDRSNVFSSLLRQPASARRDDSNTGGGGGQTKAGRSSESASSSTTAPSSELQPARNQTGPPATHDKSLAKNTEDVHHFVITDSNDHRLDAQLIRQANETTGSRHYRHPPSGDSYSSIPQMTHNLHHNQIQQPPAHPFLHYQSNIAPEPHPSPYHLQQQPGVNSYQPHPYRPQQQSDSLSRFRDWRDVSQSELGLLQRNDRIGASNITWSPYDLTPGGTSNTAEADRSQFNQYYRTLSSNQRFQSVPNDQRLGYLSQSRNKGQAADSSITRPSIHARHYQAEQSNSDTDNSIFMSRSSSHDSEQNGTNSTEATGSKMDSSNGDESDLVNTNDNDDDDDGDDGNHQADTMLGRQPTHVDYFSAYKRDWEDNKSRLKRRNNIRNGDRNDNDPDPDGAMWA